MINPPLLPALLQGGKLRHGGGKWLTSGYKIYGCYGLNVCIPLNSYAEVLMPNMTVLEGWAFGGAPIIRVKPSCTELVVL